VACDSMMPIDHASLFDSHVLIGITPHTIHFSLPFLKTVGKRILKLGSGLRTALRLFLVLLEGKEKVVKR